MSRGYNYDAVACVPFVNSDFAGENNLLREDLSKGLQDAYGRLKEAYPLIKRGLAGGLFISIRVFEGFLEKVLDGIESVESRWEDYFNRKISDSYER